MAKPGSLAWTVGDLREALGPTGRPPEAALERLASWTEVLDKWNRVQRLVGFRDRDRLLHEGLADSLAAAQLLGAAPLGPILDLGSGNGLPALIWAAVEPEREIHLVESRRKRASFLRACVREMGLCAVSVHAVRAEVLLVTEGRPRPGVLTARAFASPQKVLAQAELWGAQAVLLSVTPETNLRLGKPWALHGEAAGAPVGRRTHQLLVSSQ